MSKKIKIDGGLYKYKKFTIERIDDKTVWFSSYGK